MKKGVTYLKSLTLRDINKMSDTELQETIKIGKSILMERYKQQKSTTGVAPIWKGQTPYKINTSRVGRTEEDKKYIRQANIRTLTREIEMLGDATTTKRGYQTYLNRQNRFLEVEDMSEAEIKKVWNAYDKITEAYKSLKYKIDYNTIVKTIAESVKANYRISYAGIEKAISELTVNELGYDFIKESKNLSEKVVE